jgi:hypothetical protein
MPSKRKKEKKVKKVLFRDGYDRICHTPLVNLTTNMNSTSIEQMELGMRSQIRNGHRNVRQERQRRARWWFQRMRSVVDLALPPQTVATPRPEQTYFQLRQGNLL